MMELIILHILCVFIIKGDTENSTMTQGTQDHRLLSHWSEVKDPDKSEIRNVYEESDLPLDMRFNSGHVLSIWVYR